VAYSQVGSAKGLPILAPTGETTNVIYEEVIYWVFVVRMFNTCILKKSL
jgi:hypothetical protein